MHEPCRCRALGGRHIHAHFRHGAGGAPENASTGDGFPPERLIRTRSRGVRRVRRFERGGVQLVWRDPAEDSADATLVNGAKVIGERVPP
jgi:hypothetical protein